MLKKSIQFLYIFLFSLALFFVSPISADSECKGLSESSCKSNSDCTWVSGYTQKDGDKVKDYCRSKPGQGDDKDKSDKRKKDKDDDSDKDKKDKHKKDKDDDSDKDKKDKRKKDKDSDDEDGKSKNDKKKKDGDKKRKKKDS